MILSSRSVSGGFSLVYCSPCLIMWRCPIVVFINFTIWFLMSFYVRPGQVSRKSCLVALSRIDAVGLKSATRRYCASYGLVVWSIMLFTTTSDCCVSRVTSQITVLLFLVNFIICCSLFWTDISCLYNLVIQTLSNRTPKN